MAMKYKDVMLFGGNDSASQIDFLFEPTNFYYAELNLKQAIEDIEEIQSLLGQSSSVASVLDSDAYNQFVSLKNKLGTIYTELNGFKTKMANYKDSMLELDSSFGLVFEYLEDGNVLDCSADEYLGRNQQNSYFASVEEMDNILENYTKKLDDIQSEIASVKSERSTLKYGMSRCVDKNFQTNAKNRIAEFEKKIQALEKEYNDLYSAMSMIKTLRDYTLESAYNSYMLYDDFDAFSSETRIASCSVSYLYNNSQMGYTNAPRTYARGYVYYDKEGNVLEDVSDMEVAMYFYNSGETIDASVVGYAKIKENYDHFKYLTTDEKKIISYLTNIQDSEKTEEYIKLKQNVVNQREGQEMAQKVIDTIDNYYAKVGQKREFNDNLEEVLEGGLLSVVGQIAFNNNTYTNSDAYEDTLETLVKEGFFDGVGNFCAGLSNLFSADGVVSAEQYKVTYLMQALQERYGDDKLASMFATGTYEISNSIGNMAPSMAVGIVTGCPLAGSLLMGASAAGNAREQGLQSGMTEIESWIYGVLSGASETTLSYFLGGIPGLSKLDDIPGIKGFFTKMLSEGIEESTQSILDPILQSLVTGDSADINWGDVLKSGIYGAITAGIINGGTVVIGEVSCSINDLITDGKMNDIINKYKNQDLTNPAVSKQLIKDLTGTESDSITSTDSVIQTEVDKLNYSKVSTPQYVKNYLASNIRKYAYKDTNAFEGLNNLIMKNGLYHFTGAADAILDSGYIKSSNMNTSYGTRKTFFFNGVPEVGAFATNLDSVPIKATAVKVTPTADLVNDSKLKLRYFDDMAITYEGNFSLSGLKSEKCYFGLDAKDGKLAYKQISEEEYNNYENTDVGKVLSEYVSDKSNIIAIKGGFLSEIVNKNAKMVVTSGENISIASDLLQITDPAIIEAGIKDGTITKAQIHQLFKTFVGDNLSSWVLNDDAATSLYINLLTACKNAGISLSDIQGCIGILDSMSKYYEVARDGLQDKLETGKGFFNTYRTHGIVHAMDVLTQSINAYAAFKDVGISNLSLNSIMLSAVMHDTGMSGGMEIYFVVNSEGKLEPWIKEEAKADGGIYRKSHSFNSGVDIILEFEALKNAGYTDLEIAEAAILAFAHSKSNSGLKSLSGNAVGWSFAIQALATATKGCGFDIVDVLIKNGIIKSTDTHLEKLVVPNPSDPKDVKTKGYIEVYDFNLDWTQAAGYESLIVRIGDALTNNDNAGTNQYGKPITFKRTNYISQLSFVELMSKTGIDTSLPLSEQLAIMLERFGLKDEDTQKLSYLKLAEMEASNVTYEIDGEETSKSPQFVLGENNQTYRIEAVSDCDVEVIVSVKHSEAVPFCTIFAIDERAGELISKGDMLLSAYDGKSIKIVIELDSTTSETTKALYQHYAEHAGIDVEIREVSKLAQITDPAIIEAGIKDGTITKDQVQKLFKN